MKWCLVPAAYAAMLNSSLLGYEYLSLTLVTVFRLLVAECKDLPINACMVLNNGLGIIPTLFLAYATSEVATFEESAANWRDPGIIVLVIMSGFMGLFIGLSGLMCQKAMSATSFQVLQNMSKVVVVAMGV